jgi:hypothetical protein
MKKVFLSLLFLTATFFVTEAKSTINVCIDNQIVTADSTEFKDYYGTYKMAENPFIDKVKVYFKDGKLMSKAADYPDAELTKDKDDEFLITQFDAKAIFIRKDGVITGVKILVQGQEMEGTKEP